MIEIAVYHKIYNVPEKSDELTPAVVKSIAEVYFTDKKWYEKIHHILVNGIGMKVKWFSTDYDFVSMQLADAGVYRAMMWMIEAPFCTTNYFEKVKVGYRTLYGPEKEFDNLVFIEWLIADDLFTNWASTKDEDSLNKLAGILFRSKPYFLTKKSNAYKGDLRRAFKEEWVSEIYRDMGKLMPEWLKLYCAMWWYSCRVDIITRYENVFNNDEQSTDDSTTPMHLIQGMAGEVFGTYEMVKKTNVHECLAHLDNHIKQKNKPADGVRTY